MARKLTDEQKAEIERRYEAGKSAYGLAREFLTCVTTITDTLKARGCILRDHIASQRKLTDDQEAVIAQRYAAGESSRVLASEFSVSIGVLLTAIRRAGGTVRAGGTPQMGGERRPSAAVLRQLYCGPEKLSCKALSQRFGIDWAIMKRWLREAKIPVRSRGEQLRMELQAGRASHPNLRMTPEARTERSRKAHRALTPEQHREALAAAMTPAARAKVALALRRRSVHACTWCGAAVEKIPSAIRAGGTCCDYTCAGKWRSHRRYHPTEPRPLILALFLERMAELRKQGLPIGAATMQKAAEPIGAGGIELEAYLNTLTPREMDEYLDNQLEHDVRAAGL